MSYIKISYCWPRIHVFVPVDENCHNIWDLFSIYASVTDEGKYAIQVDSSYPSDPKNVASELVDVTKYIEVKKGQVVTFDYCTIKWNNMRGFYHSNDTFTAVVVSDDVALAETDDDVVKAQIYCDKNDYQKALELVAPHLAPNYYYEVNKSAHKLMAYMYDNGLGVDEDSKKAYMHYLYAQDFEAVDGFFNYGYGKGVIENTNNLWQNFEWNEYHALLLLNDVGENDYAYNRMIKNANDWFYKDEEKNTKRRDYKLKHKYVALSRKQACLWAMKKCDYTFGASEEFLLFAGAYCSYLSQGHEGSCSYVQDNGGGSVAHLKSTSFAEWWLNKAIEGGDEFAIKANQFIQKSKEQQQ